MSYFLNKYISILCLIFQYYVTTEALNVETRCQHGNEKVFLVDNLLKRNEIKWLNGYHVKHRPWVLNQKDSFKEISLDMKSNTTWVSPVSTEMFERTRVWKELSRILKQLTGSEQFVCYAMFTLAYRMDFKPVSNIGKPDDKGLTVQIFLNEDMKKNDYGETVFYKDNDVMCGIHHQPGRVLIWNNTLNHMPKPPSMLYVQTQNYIVLKLSNSEEEYKSCMELNKANKHDILNAKPQKFPFIAENDKLECLQHGGNINYADHLTNKYYDSHGHEIAVFDNVLSERDLNKLREYLINDYHTFGFQPYDDERSEDHDNVAWISVQESDVLAQSGLWQVVKQAATFLSGLDQWYPYDVSMNIVHSFHHTRIHDDCEPYEHEYTFLLYLNKEWHEDLYGETVYFEKVDTDAEPGDEEYEMIAAVKPGYGRIVMFRGIIPHSARPPSPGFYGARYTFACKVSKTYRSAKLKKLRETVEALHEFGVEDKVDYSEELENYEGKQPDNVVKLELNRQTQILDDLVQKRQEYFVNQLCENT